MHEKKYACFLGLIAIGAGSCFGAGPDPSASASPSIHVIDVATNNSGIESIAEDTDAFYLVVSGASGPGTGRQILEARKSGAPSTLVADGVPKTDVAILAVDATRVLWVEGGADSKSCTLNAVPKTGGTPSVLATLPCTSTTGPNPGVIGFVVDGNDAWVALGGGWFPPWAFSGGAGSPSTNAPILHVDLSKGTVSTFVSSVTIDGSAANTLAQDHNAIYFIADNAPTSGPSAPPRSVTITRVPKSGGTPTPILTKTAQPGDAIGPMAIDGSDIWFALGFDVFHTTMSGAGPDDLGAAAHSNAFADVAATHGQAFATLSTGNGSTGKGIVLNAAVYRFDTKSFQGVVDFPDPCGNGGQGGCNGETSFFPTRVIADDAVVWLISQHQIIGWDRGVFP